MRTIKQLLVPRNETHKNRPRLVAWKRCCLLTFAFADNKVTLKSQQRALIKTCPLSVTGTRHHVPLHKKICKIMTPWKNLSRMHAKYSKYIKPHYIINYVLKYILHYFWGKIYRFFILTGIKLKSNVLDECQNNLFISMLKLLLEVRNESSSRHNCDSWLPEKNESKSFTPTWERVYWNCGNANRG